MHVTYSVLDDMLPAGTFASVLLHAAPMLLKSLKTLDNKRLSRTVGALAGLTSALSMLVGLLAAYAAPHGWGRVTMALHITKKPLMMKLAPLVAGTSMTIAAVAGALGFYVWMTDRDANAEVGKAEIDPG